MADAVARVAAALRVTAALCGIAAPAHAERTRTAHPLDLVGDSRNITLLHVQVITLDVAQPR